MRVTSRDYIIVWLPFCIYNTMAFLWWRFQNNNVRTVHGSLYTFSVKPNGRQSFSVFLLCAPQLKCWARWLCDQCCCVSCRGATANTRCHPPVCPSYIQWFQVVQGAPRPMGCQVIHLQAPNIPLTQWTPRATQAQRQSWAQRKLKRSLSIRGQRSANASPFTLISHHPDVTCVSFSPTMQVFSEPAGEGSDPPREPDLAAVKGECAGPSQDKTLFVLLN